MTRQSPSRRHFLVSAAIGTAAGVVPVGGDSSPAHAQRSASRDQQELNDFLTLSRELTGVQKLNSDLGAQYLRRFKETFGSEALTELIKQYKSIIGTTPSTTERLKAIKQKIIDVEYIGAAAEQIIYIWYLSAFFLPNPKDPELREQDEPGGVSRRLSWYARQVATREPDADDELRGGLWQFGTLEQYERGLIWEVIGTHAPMTPGPSKFHWKDKPTLPSL